MSFSNLPLTADDFLKFYKNIVTTSKKTPSHQWTNLLTQLSRHLYKLFIDAKAQKAINSTIAIGQITQLANNEFFDASFTNDTVAKITSLIGNADDIRIFISTAESDDTDLIDSMQRIQDEAMPDAKNHVPLAIKTGRAFTSDAPTSKKDIDDNHLIIKNRRELIEIYMVEARKERDNKNELNALLKLDVVINEFDKLKRDLFPDGFAENDRRNFCLCLREFAVINYHYVKNMGRRLPMADAIENLRQAADSILDICEYEQISAADFLFLGRINYCIASRYFRLLDDVNAHIFFHQALDKLEDLNFMTEDSDLLAEHDRILSDVLEGLLSTYISLASNQKIINKERDSYYREAIQLIDDFELEADEHYENGVERFYDLVTDYLFSKFKISILDNNSDNMQETIQTLVSFDLPNHLSLEIFTRVLDDNNLKHVISANPFFQQELNAIAGGFENNKDNLDDHEVESLNILKNKLSMLDINSESSLAAAASAFPSNTGLFAKADVIIAQNTRKDEEDVADNSHSKTLDYDGQ